MCGSRWDSSKLTNRSSCALSDPAFALKLLGSPFNPRCSLMPPIEAIPTHQSFDFHPLTPHPLKTSTFQTIETQHVQVRRAHRMGGPTTLLQTLWLILTGSSPYMHVGMRDHPKKEGRHAAQMRPGSTYDCTSHCGFKMHAICMQRDDSQIPVWFCTSNNIDGRWCCAKDLLVSCKWPWTPYETIMRRYILYKSCEFKLPFPFPYHIFLGFIDAGFVHSRLDWGNWLFCSGSRSG
jgi:hypothetical protein